MRRGYFLTDNEAGRLYIILKFAIPQLKKGVLRTQTIKFFNKLGLSLGYTERRFK